MEERAKERRIKMFNYFINEILILKTSPPQPSPPAKSAGREGAFYFMITTNYFRAGL
jgi:hypothetical protein